MHSDMVDERSVLYRSRLNALNDIYELYETFSKNLSMACKRGCSKCCTQDVTMTTLEGCHIIQYVSLNDKEYLLHNSRKTIDADRYRPAITTNTLACFCLNGKNPPEEKNRLSSMACRFLSNDACQIYEARPFGCRCFFSKRNCETTGYAEVDPLLLTVNTLFLQFIEHIDVDGFWDNLNDVLAFLLQKNCNKYRDNDMMVEGLAKNTTIPGFLVLPEHQKRIVTILKDLKKIVPVNL